MVKRRNKGSSAGKTVLALVVVIALGAGAFLVFQSSVVEEEKVERSLDVGGQVGHVAPLFTVRSIDDGVVRLEDLRGKPTVIWFMAAWCPTCIGQSLDLQQIEQVFGNRVNIVAIDLWVPSTLSAWSERFGRSLSGEETHEELIAFKEEYGGDWIWVLDTDEATIRYDIIVVDSTILLDEHGVIVYRRNGPTSYDDLAEAIKSVL